MNQSPPDRMTPDAIVAEIGDLQKELTSKFARIHALSQGLYNQVRRSPVDDNTVIYMRYASTWMRFSGMADQGIRRSAHASKALSRLTPVEVEQPNAPPPKNKEAPAPSPVEDLLSLYDSSAQDEFVPFRDRDRVKVEAETD